MENTIFIAHPVEFFSKSLKSFGLSEGLDVYILDVYDDFEYLVKDLNPKYMLFHEDIYQEYKEYIDKVEKENDVILAIIGLESKEEKNYFVSPLDPLTLVRDLNKLIKKELDG